MQTRTGRHDIEPKTSRLTCDDACLPLGTRQGVYHLERKDVGSNELVQTSAELVAQQVSPIVIDLRHNPLEGDRAVENISHSGISPRSSRIASTPISSSP